MGNFQSNITRNTLTAFTEYLNENITQITNTATANCVAGDILTLNFGTSPPCPPPGPNLQFQGLDIDINQSARADCQLNAQFVVDINTRIENQIQSLIQNFVEQDSRNQQGFFALAFSAQINGALNSQEISNRITNIVRNNIETYCGVTSIATNEQIINLCQPVLQSRLRLNQNAAATAYVNCVSNAVVQAFLQDQVLTDVVNAVQQRQTSEQQGVGSILFYIIIIGAILLVLGIIGLIIYLLISRRSAAAAAATNIGVTVPSLGLTATL